MPQDQLNPYQFFLESLALHQDNLFQVSTPMATLWSNDYDYKYYTKEKPIMPSKRKLKGFLAEVIQKNLQLCNIKTLNWAFDRKIIKDKYVETHDGKICLKALAWKSDFSGKFYNGDIVWSQTVYVNLNRANPKREMWSQKEAQENSVYISYTGMFIAKSANPTLKEIDGHTVCVELIRLFTWEDGSLHLRERSLCGDGLPDYHNSIIPGIDNVENNLVFGCELELKAKVNRMDIYNIAKECGLSGERDGSLHYNLGIEIIGGPETLKDHQDPNGRWLKFLKKIKGKANSTQRGQHYGLHVSVNRGALTKLHTGKLVTFVHKNPLLCKSIAGRGSNEYVKFCNRKVSHGKEDSTGRYEALSIRSKKRLECRIFKSTVTASNFLRAVEFTAAAVEFTRHASARELTEDKFILWLGKNLKNYKNLAFHLKLIKKSKKFKKAKATKKVKIIA